MRRGRATRSPVRARVLTVALIAAALICSIGCGANSASVAPTAGVAATSGSAAATAAGATGFAPAAVHVGPARLYPDPNLTPGDVIAGVTAQQVCTSGYATSVRNVSQDEKKQVYRRYGEADLAGKAEVDHFISLELGGSNALTNLWPETYNPTPGAHEKDKVENYLHAQVCSGALTLQQAQQEIAGDWFAVYQSMPNK